MVKKIHFAKEYKEKILKGKKVSTIRLGKRKYSIGEVVELIVENKTFAKAKIKNVEYLTLKELSEEDARKDGFESKRKLLKALKKHYPKIKENSVVTRIEFEKIE